LKVVQTILGLFPEFRNGHIGGIQASAALAWGALNEAHAGTLVCYDSSQNGGAAIAETNNSRIKAVLSAIKQPANTQLVLVWQVGMLKLLPFLRSQPTRVALFLHGIEVWKRQDWLTSQLLKRVNLFLANSEHTWERFLSYSPTSATIPHTTVWLGIGSDAPEVSLAPDKKPAGLMLSRLSKAEDYKGHREVIRAWPRVLQTSPEAQLWIVGDGDLKADLELLVAKLQLDRHVQFFGAVPEEKKQELLERSRCLLMPSRGEGFGLVYLEAMRLGTPCLVSTLDAGREVVNPPEAGLAANPDDEVELANAIVRLLGDGPEWRQWSEQARLRYEENFTAKHFQERLLAALFPEETANTTHPLPRVVLT